MVSTLKKKSNDHYYCSNCMMMQPSPLKENCPFCGNYFSNYENILITKHIDTTVEEVKSNESKFYGRD